MPQPVVTDLAVLVGIGDGTVLEGFHGFTRRVKPGSEFFELSVVQVHAADIQPHSEVLVVPQKITESLPLNLGIRGTEIRETHLMERTLCVEVIQDPAECP